MTPSRIGTFHLDHDDDTLQIRKNASQNDGSQGSFVRTQIRQSEAAITIQNFFFRDAKNFDLNAIELMVIFVKDLKYFRNFQKYIAVCSFYILVIFKE